MPFFIRQSPGARPVEATQAATGAGHRCATSAGAKPVEATQWFPDQELPGVSSESAGHPGGGGLLPIPPHAFVHTRKGTLTVFAGDWVVTEPDGTLHVCQQRLFEQNYAPAAAEADPTAAHAETEA